MNPRPKLLVSVRSPMEAEEAILGGADLIDIKEPDAGPLGKTSDEEIAEIVRSVEGRRPVSAAFGEWKDHPLDAVIHPRLEFVKWGLAGERGRLTEVFSKIVQFVGTRAVLVLYGDADRANSPSLRELHHLLETVPVPLVLFDTFEKDGRGLLEWIAKPDLEKLIANLHRRGTRVAIAGSLDARLIPDLVAMRPDWIAVRGAACEGGRNGQVCAKRVAELASLIRATPAG